MSFGIMIWKPRKLGRFIDAAVGRKAGGKHETMDILCNYNDDNYFRRL